MLTLYAATGSCSRASHIALEEAALDYRPRFVDFAKADQTRPDFLAVNPKGRVPALVSDRGVLTEGPAILAYVAALAPEARLAPTDPFDFARMQAFNLYLASTIHVAHAHGRRAARWSDDPAAQAAIFAKSSIDLAMRDAFLQSFRFKPADRDQALIAASAARSERCAEILDRHLNGRDFMVGERFGEWLRPVPTRRSTATRRLTARV